MVKNAPANAGDPGDAGLIPGSGRSPGRGSGKLTPVFLPEKSYGQRSLAGYSSWGCKKSDTSEGLNMHTHAVSYRYGVHCPSTLVIVTVFYPLIEKRDFPEVILRNFKAFF